MKIHHQRRPLLIGLTVSRGWGHTRVGLFGCVNIVPFHPQEKNFLVLNCMWSLLLIWSRLKGLVEGDMEGEGGMGGGEAEEGEEEGGMVDEEEEVVVEDLEEGGEAEEEGLNPISKWETVTGPALTQS